MSGANATDPFAETIHGTNPQNLLEKITRLKVYNSRYWKEQCFGLTSELIIDKAVTLRYVGGTYAGNNKPTSFLCLLLKLLQLQPEKEIVFEFIKNSEFKYLRLLGAFYLRLVGKANEVFPLLEPLLNDYRKIVVRSVRGWEVSNVDTFIDGLLNEELLCDVSLPHLPKRHKLEEVGVLQPRRSLLEEEFLEQSFNESVSAMMKEAVVTSTAPAEESRPPLSTERTTSSTPAVVEERSGGDDGARRRDRSFMRSPDRRDRRRRSRSRSGDRRTRSRSRHRSRSRSRDRRHRRSSGRDRSRSPSRSRGDRAGEQRSDADSRPAAKRYTDGKQFDRMFGGRGKTADATTVAAPRTAEAPEGSVEYWNQMRDRLGLKKLRD